MSAIATVSPPSVVHPLRLLCERAGISLLRLSEASGAPYQSLVGMAAGRRPVDARIYSALRRAGHDTDKLHAEIKAWEAARRAEAQAELARAAATRGHHPSIREI